MNKLIISIIVVVIIGAGISAFLVFEKPALPEPKPPIAELGKCGDGICDDFEKLKSDLCPKDCQSTTRSNQPSQPTPSEQPQTKPPISEQPNKTTKSQEEIIKDSPFGIFAPYITVTLDRPRGISKSDINAYLNDLNVKWVQEMPRGDELDSLLKSGLNVYSRALPASAVRPTIPSNYEETLKQTIEQYKDKVKYWEVDTEPSGFPPPQGWQGYPKEYAEFLKLTYKIIRSRCSDCQVVFGGLQHCFQHRDKISNQ